MWKPLLRQLSNGHLIKIIEGVIGHLDKVCKERDEWKANHDNQVKLKQIISDRPDLKERAALVQDLIGELRATQDDNEELHIRISKLEEAVRFMNPTNEMLPENVPI